METTTIGFSIMTRRADGSLFEFYVTAEVTPETEKDVVDAMCGAFEVSGGRVVWCGKDEDEDE